VVEAGDVSLLLLDVQDPEPSEATVLMVIGLSAVVAVILGRATYRGVIGVLGRNSDPRM
jgi:hypothetical protein